MRLAAALVSSFVIAFGAAFGRDYFDQSVKGPDDVTVFKSMGIIAQDLALAELVVDRAARDGIGVELDIETGLCRAANAAILSGPALAER